MLDPPSFGRGPNKEVWKVEESLNELLDACRGVLSEKPLLILMTLYNLEASSLMLHNLVTDMTKGLGGQLTVGELALPHSASSRLLPLSLFAEWHADKA